MNVRTEASRSLKWLYCLTLITAIFPSGLFGARGWVGLATGGGMFSAGILGLVILLGLSIYRIGLVVRHPHTLDSFVSSPPIRVLRNLGCFLMMIGLIGSIAIFFIRPLALGIFGKPGDAGVAFFVVSIAINLISSAGLSGLLMFEASRLLGFEVRFRDEATANINQQVQPPRNAI